MRILFFWKRQKNKNDFNFEDGISLSRKYRITFDGTKLVILTNPAYIENFWGESIVDVTAFAGENGSGKTTVLKKLIAALNDNEKSRGIRKRKAEKIIITEQDDKTLYIFSDIDYELEATISATIIKKNWIADKGWLTGYFTNILSLSDYTSLGTTTNIYDASTGQRLRSDHKFYFEMKYIDLERAEGINYFRAEQLRELQFILDTWDIQQVVHTIGKDIVPSYITFSISNESKNISTIAKEMSKSNKLHGQTFRRLCNDILRLMPPGSFVNRFAFNVFLNFLHHVCVPFTTAETISKRHNQEECLRLMKNFIRQYDNVTSLSQEKWQQGLSNLSLEVNFYGEIMHTVDELYTMAERFSDVYSQALPDRITFHKNNSNEHEAMKALFDIYRRVSFPFLFVDIEFMQSTGEAALLKNFSDLYDMKRNFLKGTTNGKQILIIMDEADNRLHVRWQRNYIKWLTEFLDFFFKGASVQVIVATHSPILLSDFPQDSVVYMRSMKQETVDSKTFGCDIHGLFMHSFFMEDKGIIGDFARTKINSLAQVIAGENTNLKWDNDTIIRLIGLIGDEHVAAQLRWLLRQSSQERNIDMPISNRERINTEMVIEELRLQRTQLDELIKRLEHD